MNITDRLFDVVLVIESKIKNDNRGTMTVCFCEDEIKKIIENFCIKEQRVYTMPEKGTFFGIHYQDQTYPQAKLVTVIQGSGLDYIVDLRKNSETYKQWKKVELSGDSSKLVYIPQGFGHAFLSTEDNTIQLFATDEYFVDGYAKQINYKDSCIKLELPFENIILADYDKNAGFMEE